MKELNEYLPASLKHKNVLVTEGTTGIGRAIAGRLASQDAKVLIFGRNDAELKDALRDINALSGCHEAHGFTADAATQKGIISAFEQADAHFSSLDILINNAGIAFDNVPAEFSTDWKCAAETNLLGYMACAQEAIKRMKTNGKGHIVNIGSLSIDEKSKNSPVYVAAKSGIQGFNEAVRKEANELGIKVTLIEPGITGTDMVKIPDEDQPAKIQAQEMLKADDIAISVLYCLSQPKRCAVVSLQIQTHLQP